jgi:hypothetical protein
VLFELVEGEADPVVDVEQETAPEETTEPGLDENAGVSRHGAGSGGRLAALALVAFVLGIGVLALYWGITR